MTATEIDREISKLRTAAAALPVPDGDRAAADAVRDLQRKLADAAFASGWLAVMKKA